MIRYILRAASAAGVNGEAASLLVPGTAAKVAVWIGVTAVWAIAAGLACRRRFIPIKDRHRDDG